MFPDFEAQFRGLKGDKRLSIIYINAYRLLSVVKQTLAQLKLKKRHIAWKAARCSLKNYADERKFSKQTAVLY